jgi:hypothetical protein
MNSDTGPTSSGPIPRPMTNKETVKMATSLDMPNDSSIPAYVDEAIEEAQVLFHVNQISQTFRFPYR